MVQVKWVDASTYTEWQPVKDAQRDTTLKECWTVGYLMDITKKTVRIFQSACDEDDSISDLTVIPRSNVLKMRYLTK